MFGGLTHQPAIDLCRTLIDITPEGLDRVFLADSGSVSVEVAMKMALQYWACQGNSHKSRFITPRNGYHGDTFAAMSVCDPINGMHSLFSDALTQQIFAPAPQTRFDKPWNEDDIKPLEQLIEKHHNELAGLIHRSKEMYIPSTIQGGGERAVLEGKACGVAVTVEPDNFKLLELIELEQVPSHLDYANALHEMLQSVVVKEVNMGERRRRDL
jgi:hypothetical protein